MALTRSKVRAYQEARGVLRRSQPDTTDTDTGDLAALNRCMQRGLTQIGAQLVWESWPEMVGRAQEWHTGEGGRYAAN